MNPPDSLDGPIFDGELGCFGIPLPNSLEELGEIIRHMDLEGEWGQEANQRACFFDRDGAMIIWKDETSEFSVFGPPEIAAALSNKLIEFLTAY